MINTKSIRVEGFLLGLFWGLLFGGAEWSKFSASEILSIIFYLGVIIWIGVETYKYFKQYE